jgi:hypothetical protein
MVGKPQYSKSEVEALKAQILEKGKDAVCPRCGGTFEQRAVGGGGSISTVIECKCQKCGRKVALSDFFF